jgi:hypothetical protein
VPLAPVGLRVCSAGPQPEPVIAGTCAWASAAVGGGPPGSPYGHHATITWRACRPCPMKPTCRPQPEGAVVTSGDLLVLVPWVIFGVALAVICYLLLTRRYGPGRGRRARRRRPPQPPPEGQRGDNDQAPPRDQDEGSGHARPS